VKELIYKKGRGFLDKEPLPLTSNDLIEKVLFCTISHLRVIGIFLGGRLFEVKLQQLMYLKLEYPESRPYISNSVC
jgi:hypothetical protein